MADRPRASPPAGQVLGPRVPAQDVLGVVRSPSDVVGTLEAPDRVGAAAVVVEHDGPRVVADRVAAPQGGRRGIDVLAGEARPGPEPRVEPADLGEDGVAEREVGALHLAGADEPEWRGLVRRLALVERDAGVERVERHDPASHAAHLRVGVERRDHRVDVVRLQVAVVVGERDDLPAGAPPRGVPGGAQADLVDAHGSDPPAAVVGVPDDLRGVVVGGVVDDQRFPGMAAPQRRQRAQRAGQGPRPVAGADDDRDDRRGVHRRLLSGLGAGLRPGPRRPAWRGSPSARRGTPSSMSRGRRRSSRRRSRRPSAGCPAGST